MSWSTAKYACLALASTLAGCNQLEAIETESGGGGEGGIPPAVRAAFEQSCGFAGCHGPGTGISPTLAGEGLENELKGTSTAGIPYVTRGDTKNSFIAIVMLPQEVLGELGIDRAIDRMPRGGPYVGENLEIILAWIAGAEFPGGEATTGGTDTGTDTDTGDTTGTGGDEPTWEKVQKLLDTKCAGCHGSAPSTAINGNLQMPVGMAYAAIVDVKSPTVALDLIEPGDPSQSYLYLKLSGEFTGVPGSGGGMMPPGGMVTPEELELVEQWITMGALEN